MFLCYRVFICTVKMSSSFSRASRKIDIMMVLGSTNDKSVILLKSGADLLTLAIYKVTQGLLIVHPHIICYNQRFNISKLMVMQILTDCVK